MKRFIKIHRVFRNTEGEEYVESSPVLLNIDKIEYIRPLDVDVDDSIARSAIHPSARITQSIVVKETIEELEELVNGAK